MTEKELLAAIVSDAQRAGLEGTAFAEYLADRLLAAGVSVDHEKGMSLLLTAPTLCAVQYAHQTNMELLRIRYMAARGVEKAVLGDVLELFGGAHG